MYIKCFVSALSFLPLLSISQVAIAENSTKEEPVKAQELQFSSQISSNASDLIANSSISGTQSTFAQADPKDPKIEIPASPDITQPEPSFGSSVTIIPQISTLGAGLGLATPINGNLMARFGLNYTGFGINVNVNDIPYKGKINLLSVSALVDYYPFGLDSFFAITGGLAYQNNLVNGSVSSGTVDVGGTKYLIPSDSRVDANISFPNKFAPYLGITLGSSNGNRGGLSFFANLGVLFTGAPNTDIAAFGSINNISGFQNDLKREIAKAQKQVNDSLPSVYPVLSLGFTYQF